MGIWADSVQAGSQSQPQPQPQSGDRSRTKGEGRLDDPLALHNVFLFEDIVAGAEQGFVLPQAGKDGEWAKENMGEFERRAGEGDESMQRLVEKYGRRV